MISKPRDTSTYIVERAVNNWLLQHHTQRYSTGYEDPMNK